MNANRTSTTRLAALLIAGLAFLAVRGACAQTAAEPPPEKASEPPQLSFRNVGTIDLHGLRSLNAGSLRAALTLEEGDSISREQAARFYENPESLLSGKLDIARLALGVVCCDPNGDLHLFVGVVEKGTPERQFHEAPAGGIRLAPEIVQAGADFDAAILTAVQNGTAQEDRSQGHSLFRDPSTRAVQERFVERAQQDVTTLRQVLRESADARHRALAAQMLGYARDKQSVVGDLVRAMNDPAEGVRNNAMRALGVMMAAERLSVHVPYEPFIELLDSPVWTDLNKASMTLFYASNNRDPALLALLRAKALTPLVEMARWRSRGHAEAPFMIVGRIAGYTDEELVEHWARDERETVIRAALGSRSGT